MKKKILFGLIITAAMFLIMLFYRPQAAYATQSGTGTASAEKIIDLGDGHFLRVSVTVTMDYSYDEGVTGWITNTYYDGRTGSDLRVEDFQAIDCGAYGYTTYYEKYCYYCPSFWQDYTGYVYIYCSCDEWGNLSFWITHKLKE